MQKEVDAGHQVYIICPMAEPGVMDELENVVDYSKTIQAFFFTADENCLSARQNASKAEE